MEKNAVWSTAYVNSLPDSSFLYIAPGGSKDGDGKTTPRSLRYFPVKDENGKVDLPHVRNALARIPQSDLSDSVKASCTAKANKMMSQMGGGNATYTASFDSNAATDEGDGLIRFNEPVTISDDTPHWNGKRYDIQSMDIGGFDHKLRSNHEYGWDKILAGVIGTAKNGAKLTIEGLKFYVKQSPLARFAYEMVKAGAATDLSVGVNPGEEDDDGLEHGAKLAELSLVGLGNNPAAKIKSIAANSIEQAAADGLDTSELEAILEHNGGTMDPKEAEKLKAEKEAAEKRADEAETKLAAHEAGADEGTDEGSEESDGADEGTEDGEGEDDGKATANAVAEAIKPLQRQMAKLQKHAFSKAAKEPEFTKGEGDGAGQTSGVGNLHWKERTQLQIESYWKANHKSDADAAKVLREVNEYNKSQLLDMSAEDLSKMGLDKHAVSLTDFGNFVTSPELLREIEGYRTDFASALSAFPYQVTNTLQMGWLERQGDVDMQHVSLKPGEDGQGNLKPLSSYSATPRVSRLEELAAVTPVVNATTIFLAADLLGDVAAGYRVDYDRKLAQLAIARLQQGIEDHPENSVSFPSANSTTADKVARLEAIRQAVFQLSQMGNGVLVMSEATYGIISGLIFATGNGFELGSQQVTDGAPLNYLWRRQVVVVPNELLPTLGNSDYKTFVVQDPATDDSLVNVDITHAIFYVETQRWSGRQHNGLQYDLSAEAAYEEADGTVKSSFQRNEIVLRGAMFRGGQYRDTRRLSALRAETLVSS